MKTTDCPICGRKGAPASRHHLTPRSRDKKRRKRDDPPALAGTCVDCHRKIHSLYTNKVLAEQFAAVDKLRVAPGMPEWIAFISRRPVTERVTSRGSNRRES
ncbi:MAG TPA: HNH endonuclease [Planctomycetota bacterium]|nr:HNH endonuclease [Planctomycetota bacterium]